MAGTTPTYAWPYPTGTDLVSQGDNAMEALAKAVENTVKVIPTVAMLPPGTFASKTTSAAPDTYPRGLSIYQVQPSDGWPYYGTLVTWSLAGDYAGQILFGNSSAGILMRTWIVAIGWRSVSMNPTVTQD